MKAKTPTSVPMRSMASMGQRSLFSSANALPRRSAGPSAETADLPSAHCASITPAPTVSGWCRSKAGRSERIRGMLSKLCRGGGQEVAHSSEAP